MAQFGRKKINLSTKNNVNRNVSIHKNDKQLEFVSGSDSLSPFSGVFSSSSQTKTVEDSLFNVDTTNSKKNSSLEENDLDVFEFPQKKKFNLITSKNSLLGNKTIKESRRKLEDDSLTVLQSSKDSGLEIKNESVTLHDKSENEVVLRDGVKDQNKNHANSEGSSGEITISDINHSKNNLLPENTEDLMQISSNTDALHHCPICLKPFSASKYVSHMKTCASKNKLSTQQLLSALQLHKEQQAERKKLGLNLPPQTFRAKVSPKKTRIKEKKAVGDSSLQLALALSESLRSAEEAELLQEAGALQAAGLETEAELKLSTLEKFGFASALPVAPRTGPGGSRIKPTAPTLLLRRTKDERDRIITEKMAIVLIGEEESTGLDLFTDKKQQLKSRSLRELWNEEAQLWEMSHCPCEEERGAFYISSLAEFISPCKVEVGEGLRRLSQLAGRMNTPVKEDIAELPTPPRLLDHDDNDISELPTPPNLGITKSATRASTFPTITDKLSEDWRTLVGNTQMSDVEVRCEGDSTVPAHKLVFFVRCPSILSEIVKDNSNMDVLNWNNYSKISVLAFLEFIYSADFRKLNSLDFENLSYVCELADKFDVSELQSFLNENSLNSPKKNDSKCDTKRELFMGLSESKNSPCNDLDNSLNDDIKSISQSPTSSCNKVDLYQGRESPDLFEEPRAIGNDASDQEDLDSLASLVGKTTAEFKLLQSEETKSTRQSTYSPINSSSILKENETRKRKKSTESISEAEELSFSKKICSFSSPPIDTENKDEVYDLTQSSNSSNEVVLARKKQDSDEDLISNKNCSPSSDNDISNLTQSKFQSDYSPMQIEIAYSEEPEMNNGSWCRDYKKPIWDVSDDNYLHYNYESYTPAKSEKSFATKSTVKKNSAQKSLHVLSPTSPKIINSISSESKSSDIGTNKTPCRFNQTPTNKSYSSEKSLQKTFSNSLKHKELSESPSKSFCKSRRNLNKHFDLTGESPNDISFPLMHSPSTSKKVILPDSPEKINKKHKQSSCKKESLTARLLNETLDVSDSVFATADALLASEDGTKTSKCDTPRQNSKSSSNPSISHQDRNISCKSDSMATPPSEIIVSDDVTPLPDYSAMKTPAIKKELSRFGLKPSLGKRKAKLLLRHIYDQTHPVVEDHVQVFKEPTERPPRSPVKSPHKAQSTVDVEDSDSDGESCSQRSTSSSISSSVTLPEESFCEPEDFLTQELSNTGDIKSSIRSLILSDPELHRKVLVYEPIYLEQLMATLKNNGIKSKINSVMDFLDEQCITFRTSSWKATNEKRRLKQKSPKKKRSVVSDSSSSVSSETNVKKRGRPRKTDKNS